MLLLPSLLLLVAGVTTVACIPAVVPFVSAVAGIPAVAGVPAIAGVPAVARVPADRCVHILAVVFTNSTGQTHIRLWKYGTTATGLLFFSAFGISNVGLANSRNYRTKVYRTNYALPLIMLNFADGDMIYHTVCTLRN